MNSISSEPLYIQLKDKIIKDIETGIYKKGTKIPSEVELCSKYGVSRITVRKTMSILSFEGVLDKKQGKGTFVSEKTRQKQIQLQQIREYIKVIDKKSSNEIISTKKIDDKIQITKLHSADDIPFAVEYNYFTMAYSYLLDIKIDISIYKTLSMFDIYPTNIDRTISLTKATPEIQRLLNVPENTTLLLLNENIYDQKGRILHTSVKYINCKDKKIEL